MPRLGCCLPRFEDYPKGLISVVPSAVASAFLAVSRGGDFAALAALLDSDITLNADGASVPAGRPAKLHGAEQVAKGAVLSGTRATDS